MKNSFWSHADVSPDSYSLFRGSFVLAEGGPVEFRVIGASWYEAWLDGKWLLEGPPRYPLDRPEYQTQVVDLPAGEHLLAFHAHHIGVETRILKETPPFLWVEAVAGTSKIPIEWRGRALESQGAQTRRINPQLGWIEWRDTRLEPDGWQQADYNAANWQPVVWDASPLPVPTALDLAPVRSITHELSPLAEGPLATCFGYATDESAYIFHSRDRECAELPAKGLWRRYDLGRVRLGRPRFVIDAPVGAIIEFGYAEYLTDGRVSPYINLSGGTSCNLDRFIARGGVQEFRPLTPKGGRFMEVHVVNARENVRFIAESYLETCYLEPAEATFKCGDSLLETIWHTGLETFRACAEDSVIDNPTRERGQWVGDVAAVGMEIAAVAWHDIRLCKRALVHAAFCPREDGLVAGMSPGGCVYLPTYAFQWAVAVVAYHRHTGDKEFLESLWQAALRNMSAIRAFWHDDGLHNVAGWNFVDWGYKAEDGPVDTACNLHYLWSLRAMREWAETLGHDGAESTQQAEQLTNLLQQRISEKLAVGGWRGLGYHCATLAMCLGLISDEEACLDYLQAHLLDCFPNQADAPRNDDPTAFDAQLITPYFAHYVLPLFIEHGRMDFVLGQFRKCWGDYMLADGRTTWIEVFDTRWSHCHQWSGCPTWQLSRYLLGLHPRMDLGPATYQLRIEPGSLDHATGSLPHPQGGWIKIDWKTSETGLLYHIRTPQPLSLRFPDGECRKIIHSAEFTIHG